MRIKRPKLSAVAGALGVSLTAGCAAIAPITPDAIVSLQHAEPCNHNQRTQADGFGSSAKVDESEGKFKAALDHAFEAYDYCHSPNSAYYVGSAYLARAESRDSAAGQALKDHAAARCWLLAALDDDKFPGAAPEARSKRDSARAALARTDATLTKDVIFEAPPLSQITIEAPRGWPHDWIHPLNVPAAAKTHICLAADNYDVNVTGLAEGQLKTVRKQIDVRKNSSDPIVVDMRDEFPLVKRSTWPLTGSGAAIGGGLAVFFIGLLADTSQQSALDACNLHAGCSNRDEISSNIALFRALEFVGGAAAGTGALLLGITIAGDVVTRRQGQHNVACGVGPGALSCGGAF